MRWLLAVALVLSPAAAGAQTVVQQNAAPTSCGATCGASAGTVVSTSNGYGTILSLDVVTAGTGGYVVVYDNATLPADGALNPALIRYCLPLAANTGQYVPFATPIQFYYGVAVFVSSNSCTTKAAVAYGFVNAQVR